MGRECVAAGSTTHGGRGRGRPLALPGQNVPSGNAIAVRPSGTEPKVKFYLFGIEPVANSSGLAEAQKLVSERIAKMKVNAKQLSG